MTEKQIKKAEHMKKFLKPYAELFGVEVDYIWDGPQELLVVDGTEICCGGNSEYGVMEEFIAYLFIRCWKERWLGYFEKQTKNVICQFWRDRLRAFRYMPPLHYKEVEDER